jgi:hypothetical protein
MIPLDVHAYIGQLPFRHLPHPDPEILVKVLAREGIARAWVAHLPTAFHRDPGPGNAELFARLEPFGETLIPTPTVRPDWPGWERTLRDHVDRGVPAIRAWPMQWGMGAHDGSMRALVAACGEAGVAVVLAVKFEDVRQRHWMDSAGDLSGPHVRALARVSPRTRLVVLGAGRELVEEVHWGLTPDEQSRLWWDISWLWGPPEDHLALLFRTMGAERFVYGTGWPLRLTQAPRANLDLLPRDLQDAELTDASSIAPY